MASRSSCLSSRPADAASKPTLATVRVNSAIANSLDVVRFDTEARWEDVRDRRGRRITQAYVDEAVADVHAKTGRGRPSLTGRGSTSPQVTFRLPLSLREEAEAQAREEGTKVSAVARKALEEYLKRHRNAS
jgi:hypothetical protein